MRIELPAGFTPGHLRPPGGGSAIHSLGEGDTEFEWRNKDKTVTFRLEGEQLILPDDADKETLDWVQAGLARVGQPREWEKAIDDLRGRASDLVGVRALSLSAAQRNLLVVLILWCLGILDNQLRIRPLDEWLKRRRPGWRL